MKSLRANRQKVQFSDIESYSDSSESLIEAPKRGPKAIDPWTRVISPHDNTEEKFTPFDWNDDFN